MKYEPFQLATLVHSTSTSSAQCSQLAHHRSTGGYYTISFKAECVNAQKRLLPRASHSGEITLAGLRRLRSKLAAASVHFVLDAVTNIKISKIISPEKS